MTEVISIVFGVLGLAFAGVRTWMNKESIARLRSLEEDLSRRRVTEELLRQKLPIVHTHTVILDGGPGSGKSTFIARLASPVMTREQLKKITSTKQEYKTLEAPICWQHTKNKNEHRTVLHALRYCDIAGEKGSTLINTLRSLSKDKAQPVQQDQQHLETTVRAGLISVIIWDLSDAGIKRNREHLNETRIETAYGNNDARDLISSIIVFFNKCDTLPRGDMEARISGEKSYLQGVFKKHFEAGYGEIEFHIGSALTGEGLYDCYGSVISKLQLAGNYVLINGTPGLLHIGEDVASAEGA